MIYNDSIVFVYAAKEVIIRQTEKGLRVRIAEQDKTVWFPREWVTYSTEFGGGWNMELWLAKAKGLEYDPYPAGDYPDPEFDWTGRATH